MKSVLLTSLALVLALGATEITSAQSKDGAITPQLLEQLRKSEPNTPTERALHNAIALQGMKDFFVNPARPRSIEDSFSIEVKSAGISDQQQSGRCWLFTGLNVLRAQFMAREKSGTFFFSQNYSFFWDQLEKANLFLEGIIETRKAEVTDKKVEWLFKKELDSYLKFKVVKVNYYKVFQVFNQDM